MGGMASGSPLAPYLKRKKLSDLEFARRIGVDDSTVYRWRTGKRRPDVDMVFLIERATGGEVPASAWSTGRVSKAKRARAGSRKGAARVAARSSLNDKHPPQST
jgi:transcriptional regulator with XRE-family HTH domain